ncbi:MAG: HAD family phosphatase [Oscillospiraceae bacterium]|nr:HAD family phosphatase [Oscillospiraceae bacterium]
MYINKRQIKGAIFDLDGTLLDSMAVWHDVDVQFFSRRNIEMPADYQEKIKNMHFPSAAEYTKARFSLPDSIQSIIDEWRSLCFEAYQNHIRLKDGANEFLHTLHENGVKIAYATASEEQLCSAVLTSNNVIELFSAKAYVEEAGKSKAHPDVYLLASERLGLKPSECMVFEDILQGVRGAKKGGFPVCGVYDSCSKSEAEEIKRVSDLYITSFWELL